MGRVSRSWRSSSASAIRCAVGRCSRWNWNHFRSAPAREVGKIWGAEYDIDVAGTLLDDTVVVGECKWWDAPVGCNVFEQLRDDAARTDYADDATEIVHLLFAKSGFTDELTQIAADRDDLELVTPTELLLPR